MKTTRTILLLLMACQALVSYGVEKTFDTKLWVTKDSVIAEGDVIVLKAEMGITGSVTWNNGIPTPNTTFTNNGTIICESDLLINSGNFINNGVIIINGHDFTFSPKDGNGLNFYNHGVMNLTDCKFTISGNGPCKFVNDGDICIDNPKNTTGKDVNITGVNITNTYRSDQSKTVYFAENSLLHIKNSNLDIKALGGNEPQSIDGTILIEDGNFIFKAGGGGVTTNVSASKGGIFLLDTDNSDDDGVLNIAFGGGNDSFNISGKVFAEGVNTSSGGGGARFNINDGGVVYINQMGASSFKGNNNNNNKFVVHKNGTLNYCGNLTPGKDDVGTINNEGILNYATPYYGENNDPVLEGDFVKNEDGVMNPMWDTQNECSEEYEERASNMDEPNPLPIKLVYFKGEIVEDAISLIWQTASEKNNEGFKIEESLDGIIWKEVGFEYGAGNSSININYEYNLYELPNVDLVYYRLKQVDFDGSYEYSPIVSLSTNTNVEYVYFNLNNQRVDSNNLKTGLYVMHTWVNGKIIKASKIFVK